MYKAKASYTRYSLCERFEGKERHKYASSVFRMDWLPWALTLGCFALAGATWRRLFVGWQTSVGVYVGGFGCARGKWWATLRVASSPAHSRISRVSCRFVSRTNIVLHTSNLSSKQSIIRFFTYPLCHGVSKTHCPLRRVTRHFYTNMQRKFHKFKEE